jgi:hypothetical protein
VPRALADHHLAGLDPGRADLDQHLPGAGHRRATSSTRSTSIPPYSWNRTAFIA